MFIFYQLNRQSPPGSFFPSLFIVLPLVFFMADSKPCFLAIPILLRLLDYRYKYWSIFPPGESTETIGSSKQVREGRRTASPAYSFAAVTPASEPGRT